MTEVHSIKELREQSKAGKLSIIALLFLPLIGLLCLFWPEESAHYLPYVLGIVMILSGIGGIIVAASKEMKNRTEEDEAVKAKAHEDALSIDDIALAAAEVFDSVMPPAAQTPDSRRYAAPEASDDHEDNRSSRSVGTAIVMCVLGAVILFHGSTSISFVGVMWGLLGLYKAGEEFDEIIHRIRGGHRFVFKLAFSVFELVLAVLLILHPFANIDHHMILLGLELITYPFKIDRADSGKFTLEAEA